MKEAGQRTNQPTAIEHFPSKMTWHSRRVYFFAHLSLNWLEILP